MRGTGRFAWCAPLAVLAFAGLAEVSAETPIDAQRSTVTISVFKSGLFSAFADNHTVRAPIAEGSISETAPLSVSATFHSADLRVLDPDMSPSKRAEVQTRMLSADVLDVDQYPEIRFVSTTVELAGPNRWNVAGRLTLHGRTNMVSFPVTREGAGYRGAVTLKQRDYGITPITIAGGAVKVKDELKIEFVIVPVSQSQ